MGCGIFVHWVAGGNEGKGGGAGAADARADDGAENGDEG